MRNVFNDYLPDVWIHLDNYKGDMCGPEKGFGAAVRIETDSGVILSNDSIYSTESMPEDFGKDLALKMLSELMYETTIDSFM